MFSFLSPSTSVGMCVTMYMHMYALMDMHKTESMYKQSQAGVLVQAVTHV
jgi:hypothetical protein